MVEGWNPTDDELRTMAARDGAFIRGGPLIPDLARLVLREREATEKMRSEAWDAVRAWETAAIEWRQHAEKAEAALARAEALADEWADRSEDAGIEAFPYACDLRAAIAQPPAAGADGVCPECRAEPPEHKGPGVPVPRPGMLHHADCPTLPRLSPEGQDRLNADLARIAESRRRAWAEGAHHVIGRAAIAADGPPLCARCGRPGREHEGELFTCPAAPSEPDLLASHHCITDECDACGNGLPWPPGVRPGEEYDAYRRENLRRHSVGPDSRSGT